MKFIKLNQHTIEYYEAKVAHPKGTILFCHGFGGAFVNFAEVMQQVSDYDYYAFNCPGHGRSIAYCEKDFSMFKYAELVIEFIKQKKLQNVILVGHSMGGAVAALAYRLNPTVFHKVFLIAPVNKTIADIQNDLYGLFFPLNFADWKQKAVNFYTPAQMQLFLNDPLFVASKEIWIKFINQDSVFARGFRTLGPSMLLEETGLAIEEGIKKINCLFMMVYGQFDKIINTPVIAKYYQQVNPNCLVHEFKDCNHSPWNEDLSGFVKVFKNFLAK